MQRDLKVYLQDVLESCELIIKHTESVSADEFRMNTMLQDAVIRRFKIIGEAVKHVPNALREKYPNIEWKNAAAFRDVLVHDYPDIIIDDVYHTSRNHLPAFRSQIAAVLDDLRKN
jgi:uncharacterized protein with HEPN domain